MHSRLFYAFTAVILPCIVSVLAAPAPREPLVRANVQNVSLDLSRRQLAGLSGILGIIQNATIVLDPILSIVGMCQYLSKIMPTSNDPSRWSHRII